MCVCADLVVALGAVERADDQVDNAQVVHLRERLGFGVWVGVWGLGTVRVWGLGTVRVWGFVTIIL